MKVLQIKSRKTALSARIKALKLRNKTALPESLKLKLSIKQNNDRSESLKNDLESNHIDSQICDISPINWEVNHEDDLFDKESTHSANVSDSVESTNEPPKNGQYQQFDNATTTRGPYLPPKIKALFRNARYYLIKSCNHENVSLAKSRCVWATPRCNEIRLNKAFEESENVILIFSVKESGRFQGYARISAKSDPSIRVGWVLPAGMNQRHLSGAFRIDWVSKSEVSFSLTGHLINSWNDNKPVKIGRDGQDIEPQCGENLCRLFPLENERLIDALCFRNQSNRGLNDFRKNTPALLPSPVNLPPKQHYENNGRNRSRNNQFYQHNNNRHNDNDARPNNFTHLSRMNLPPPMTSLPPPGGIPVSNHLPPMNLAAPPPPMSMPGQFGPGRPPLQFAPQRLAVNPPAIPGLPGQHRIHQMPGAPPMQYIIHPGHPPVSMPAPMPNYQAQLPGVPQVMPPHVVNTGQPPHIPGPYYATQPNPTLGHSFMPQGMHQGHPPGPPIPQAPHSFPPGMMTSQAMPPGIPQIPQPNLFPPHQSGVPQQPQSQAMIPQHQAPSYGMKTEATQGQSSSEAYKQQARQSNPYVESPSSPWSSSKEVDKIPRHGGSSHRQKSSPMARPSRREDHHSNTESKRRSPDLDGIDKELLMKGNYYDYLRYSTGRDSHRESSKQKDDKTQYEDRVASFLMQLSNRDAPQKSTKARKAPRPASTKKSRSSSSSEESCGRSRDVADHRKPPKRVSPSHTRHRRKSRSNSRTRRRR